MSVLNYKLRLFIVVILLFGACSENENSIVDRSDKIMIKYFNNGDTLTRTTESRSELENFKNVLKGKMQSVSCNATGTMFFYVKDGVVYSVNFSTEATGADDECQYLILGEKGWLLSYNTGMFLDETFYVLKKEK
jgi:hypothetical protein